MQTAVDGRNIDNTIHMLRDFIQLANNERGGGEAGHISRERGGGGKAAKP